MPGINCEQCGSAMAAADTACMQCGAPAPAGKAALLLMRKAEQLWGAGDLHGAVQQLERALQGGLPAEALPLAWRKLGVWLEKEALESGQSGLLGRAGEAFKTALGMDDKDEAAHQLFIANLGKQGQLGQARIFYQKRLDLDSADAVAARQLNVIKLSADFLAAPPPVAPPLPLNVVERWLQPRPWKVASAALTLVSSLAMVAASYGHEKPVVDSGELLAAPIDLDSMLYDANLWGLQAILSGLALLMMYRMRKR